MKYDKIIIGFMCYGIKRMLYQEQRERLKAYLKIEKIPKLNLNNVDK